MELYTLALCRVWFHAPKPISENAMNKLLAILAAVIAGVVVILFIHDTKAYTDPFSKPIQ